MNRRAGIAAVVPALFLASSAGAIDLGGRSVPKDRFVVYLFIGHSNMAGRVDDIEAETYETHPRAWNYKFDDGTDAWIPAQPPVHRDVSWQRGGGPATPFLKRMAELYPGYYIGVIQNAHSSVEIVNDYRRGRVYYDEIVAVANQEKANFTFGGVLAMFGAMEDGNQAWSNDFGNQLAGMMTEFRQDLGEADLPLLINRLTQGDAYWQTVQNNIVSYTSSDPYAGIVPSDGPYKPGDNVHYTWVGHKLWGQAAADLVAANGWFPGSAGTDTFPPLIASIEAASGTSVEVVFGEGLNASSAQTPGNYALSPSVAVTAASLAPDQKTVTLTTAPLSSGTVYTLTVNGVMDISGNAAGSLMAQFTFVYVDVPYAGLQLWLRADEGVMKDSLDHVPLWVDQSGNGNDVIKARFNNQPWYYADMINGKPALRFNELGTSTIFGTDGEYDWLERTLPASYTGDSTLFMVFRARTVGQLANSSVFNSSNQTGGSNATFQIEVDGANPGVLQLYSDAARVIGPTTASWQVLATRIAGTSLEFYVDGTGSGSYSIGASEAKTYNHYILGKNRGENAFLECEIAEVLLYHAALSAADRQKVEQYLGGKYALIAVPPGITVTPTGGLVTTEGGGTDSFTVVLDAAPSSSVTIPVSSSNPGEGTVSTSSLVFTASDWSAPQTVTVAGVDDGAPDGDVQYAVILGAATSSDSGYDGMDPVDVDVVNRDDEGANQPPQAVIVGPAATNVGVGVSYYGGNSTDDGTIVGYDWDFGDGATDAGDFVSYSWSAEGTYTVTLTVTDDGGLQDQETLVVDVGPSLQPSITILRPVGGEVWPAGSTQSIQWTTTNLDDVRLEFSSDGGSTWQLIDFVDTNDPGWGDYPWQVPDVNSTQCIVLVQGYFFEAPTQSAPFEIAGTVDSDGDGWSDADEVTYGTDRNDKDSYPAHSFHGLSGGCASPGEGAAAGWMTLAGILLAIGALRRDAGRGGARRSG